MARQWFLDWHYRGTYIRGRHGIRPTWADEAFADSAAVVESPDHASKSGETDRLVGYSPTAGMVITVIYLRDRLIGVNAWPTNPTDIRRYYEED
jgi:hypothetical protein